MRKVMNYVIGGIIALLVLFSLAPTVFDQYVALSTEEAYGDDGTQTAFDVAPAGIEAVVGAVLTIFFVLVLWKMYNDAM